MPLPIGSHMPALDSATSWLGESVTSGSLRGHPILVQFWAISCPMCKLNMPKLLQLMDTYQGAGLRLVSVHMPRMESDMDVEKVREATHELSLAGSCAIDNTHAVGDAFQTGNVWPCYFLFDSDGKLRSRAAGELGIKMAENSLKRVFVPDAAVLSY